MIPASKIAMENSTRSFRRYGACLCIVPVLLAIFSQAHLWAQSPTVIDVQPAATQSNFDAVDLLMQQAVARGNIPGGVVLIGHNGKVVYRKAFGSRSLEPTHEAMTVDTIFDLASLTKCVATTRP